MGTADLGRPASAWSSADASPRKILMAEVLRSGKPGSFRTSNTPTTLRPATMLRRYCSWSTTPRLGQRRSQRSSTLLSAQPRILRGNECGSSSWSVDHRRSPRPAKAPTSGLTFFDRRTPRMKVSILFLTNPQRSYLTTRNCPSENEKNCSRRLTAHSLSRQDRYHPAMFSSNSMTPCTPSRSSSPLTPS